MSTHARYRNPSATGFTLMEVLVVIVVLVILIGIGLAVGPAVMAGGQNRVTRTTLTNAQAIFREYDDITGNGHTVESTRELLRKCRSIPEMQAMIGGLPDEIFGEAQGDATLVDGFEKEIHLWNPVADDPEPQDGNLPDRDEVYFASRGVDGKWGDVDASGGSDDLEESADNIYSFALESQ